MPWTPRISGRSRASRARGPGRVQLDLVRGVFLRRYKRFFADVEIPGVGTVTAHCANTGTMRTLLEEGAPAWLRHSTDPKRKLAYTLVLLGVPGGRALVDTSLPNRIVAEAIEEGTIPTLSGYGSLRREVKVGERSRLDIQLENPADGSGRACAIEVKNVTMRSEDRAGRGDFPDAVTDRGRKHLDELATLAEGGTRAVQLYFLGRTDCDRVGVASSIDPAYAAALERARDCGVEVVAVRASIEDGEGECISIGARGECGFEE